MFASLSFSSVRFGARVSLSECHNRRRQSGWRTLQPLKAIWKMLKNWLKFAHLEGAE